MRLTRNFSLDEFLESETAERLGVPMEPGTEEIIALTALCCCLLQPVRDAIDRPMRITSGWRPKSVNRAVGGSDTSQHVLAEAADCYAEGLTPHELARRIEALNVDFGQMIVYPHKKTVHLSYSRRGNNNREILTWFEDGDRLSGIVER